MIVLAQEVLENHNEPKSSPTVLASLGWLVGAGPDVFWSVAKPFTELRIGFSSLRFTYKWRENLNHNT